jgi:TRAP-type mannitol/chloroaromatic compound transport system substrate-binding protein
MSSKKNSIYTKKILESVSVFSHIMLSLFIIYETATHATDIYNLSVRPSTNVYFKYLQTISFFILAITLILIFFVGVTTLYKEISKKKPHRFIDFLDTKLKDIRFRRVAIPLIFLSVMGSVISTIINRNLDNRAWQFTVSWQNSENKDVFPSVLKEDLEDFKKEIENSTDGKIRMEYHNPPDDIESVFSGMKEDKFQMLSSVHYYYPKSTETNRIGDFFASIPFGKEYEEYNDWMKNGGGQYIWDTLCKNMNAKPFPFGHTGKQPAGWFINEFTLKNMNKLSMRIPYLPGLVLAKMGAKQRMANPTQIKNDLDSKKINAFEYVGPHEDMAMELHNTEASNFYLEGWHEEDTMLAMYLNKKYYDRLDLETQKIIAQIIEKYNLKMSLKLARRNEWAVSQIKANKNIKFNEFLPKGVKEALFHNWLLVLKEKCAAQDKGFKNIFSSYAIHSRNWRKMQRFNSIPEKYDFSTEKNLAIVGLKIIEPKSNPKNP